MADPTDKKILIAELAAARNELGGYTTALRHDLDFSAKLKRDVWTHPTVWFGGAAVLEAEVSDDVVNLIAAKAGGDGRTGLNILELAWQTAQAAGSELTAAHVEDAARKRPLVYDRAGDRQLSAGGVAPPS